MRGARATRTRTAWLAGLVIGVAAGALSLVIPMIGWTIGIAFTVGALVSHATVPSFGGLLLGSDTIWSTLLVLADSRCREGCTSPHTTPWILVGVAMLVGGVALTVMAAIRSRRGAIA